MDLHVFRIPLSPPTSLSTHIRAFLNTLTIFCCCCCSIIKLCPTLVWLATRQAPLSSTISQTLLKLMSIESVMPSNHLILCCSLLLLTFVFLSIRVFSNESALHIKWPKYWSFSFILVLPMNIQGRFPLGLTDLMSLLSKGHSRVFSTTTVWKHQSFSAHLLYSPTHIHTWPLERP